MSARLPRRSEVAICAEAGVPERCLRFPTQALPGVKLPGRILVEGSAKSRVVGAVRIPGAEDETVVQASAQLCEEIEPGSSGEVSFGAHVSKARWRDSAGDLGGWTIFKLVTAPLAAIAGIAGAVVAFLSSEVGIGIAIAVLCALVLVALFKLVTGVRDALAIKCG